MGAHAISQPAREYLCKIIELSLFAADFILAHALLFLLLPVLCVPLIDKWHSVILFWLRPSRQIRAPIFSMKQNRLRKRIVRRYATLFFIILVVFIALIVGPLVAGTSYSNSILIFRKQGSNKSWRLPFDELGFASTRQWQSESDDAGEPQRYAFVVVFVNKSWARVMSALERCGIRNMERMGYIAILCCFKTLKQRIICFCCWQGLFCFG
jgi:hypothetical protein